MVTAPNRILVYAAVAALIGFVLWLSRIYWRRKLSRWASDQGLKLVTFRGAWFYEGPSKFVRSRNQHVFRAVVEDRDGIQRSCWLLFGTFWGFTFGMPLTKVVWDDETDL